MNLRFRSAFGLLQMTLHVLVVCFLVVFFLLFHPQKDEIGFTSSYIHVYEGTSDRRRSNVHFFNGVGSTESCAIIKKRGSANNGIFKKIN